jgi:predicted DNA-binding transcriptional regulator AlpA
MPLKKKKKTPKFSPVTPVQPTGAILGTSEVAALLGFNRVTFFKWRQRGDFPRGVRLPGGTREYWRRADVEAWIASLESFPPANGAAA